MDSPLPSEELARPEELGESARERIAPPSRGVRRAPNAPGRRRSRESLVVAPLWRRPFIFTAAVIGIMVIAVLIFGATRNFANRGTSVTTKIPDATTAGAAVANLPPPNLLKPLSPDQAAKENAERPFVSRPDTPASRFVLKAGAEDRERALTCLTQAVYYEAASEGTDGGRAVAQVILNRLHHPGYPASICGVVYQGSDRPTGCQFTFTCDGSLLRPHVEALWTRSQKIARDALDGHVFAPVGHATHYHADYVLPYWADSLDKTVQIGRHIFYRLRGSVGDSRSFFQRYVGFELPIPAPRPAIIAAPVATEAEQQQLAKVLIGEDSKGTAKDAEKIAVAASPLLVDNAARGTLIADEQGPAIKSPHPKSSKNCSTDGDSKRLSPLAPNDMHAVLGDSGC